MRQSFPFTGISHQVDRQSSIDTEETICSFSLSINVQCPRNKLFEWLSLFKRPQNCIKRLFERENLNWEKIDRLKGSAYVECWRQRQPNTALWKTSSSHGAKTRQLKRKIFNSSITKLYQNKSCVMLNTLYPRKPNRCTDKVHNKTQIAHQSRNQLKSGHWSWGGGGVICVDFMYNFMCNI